MTAKVLQEYTERQPRSRSNKAALTWMGEMHFRLDDHPLGRQWGRVLTVGVDWTLELYCKNRTWGGGEY